MQRSKKKSIFQIPPPLKSTQLSECLRNLHVEQGLACRYFCSCEDYADDYCGSWYFRSSPAPELIDVMRLTCICHGDLIVRRYERQYWYRVPLSKGE